MCASAECRTQRRGTRPKTTKFKRPLAQAKPFQEQVDLRKALVPHCEVQGEVQRAGIRAVGQRAGQAKQVTLVSKMCVCRWSARTLASLKAETTTASNDGNDNENRSLAPPRCGEVPNSDCGGARGACFKYQPNLGLLRWAGWEGGESPTRGEQEQHNKTFIAWRGLSAQRRCG